MDKSTRIRYKLIDNKFVSTVPFLGNEGTLLKSVIDPGTGTVTVYRVGDNDELIVVESVPYTLFSKAKVVAKSMLKKYGVNFLEEVRNKRVTKAVVDTACILPLAVKNLTE